MDRILILKEDDIIKLTSFTGNIDIDKLTPFIYTAQSNEIRRVLGTDLYNKIVSDFDSDTLSGDYLTIYNDYIIDMLVYYAASDYLTFGIYQINNGGIYRHEAENSVLVEQDDVNKLVMKYNSLAAKVELNYFKFIKTITIPEIDNNDCDGKDNSFKFPWFL